MTTRFVPMVTSQMSMYFQHLRTSLEGDGEVTDGELLNRFLKQRDDAALASLVQRHARMVWGVCRRLLRSQHDTEDAFQATFLVLVRKAATIRDKEMVANWLYGVAHQTAVRLRAMAAKKSVRERQVTEMPEPIVPEARVNELLPLLDQELSRLPEHFRVLIVLCDLENKTRKEVAHQLGCPEGTVASRLARARELLARRLSQNGASVSGCVLASVFTQGVASAPASVVASTIKATSLMVAGKPVAAGLVSQKAVTLTEAMVTTMFVIKIKSVLSVVMIVGVVVSGAISLGLLNGSVAVALSGANPFVYAKNPEEKTGQQPKLDDKPKFEKIESEEIVAEHPGGIYSLAMSRDGKRVATGGFDNTILVWDTSDWKKAKLTLKGHKDAVPALGFSPDGKTLASSAHDNTVRLWNTGTGEEIKKLEDPKCFVRCVAFSPDGTIIAGACTDKMLRLWDSATGKLKTTFEHREGVLSVAFSPSGKKVMAGCKDGMLTLWDLETGKAQTTLEGHQTAVASLTFAGEDMLVSGDGNGNIIFWNLTTKEKFVTAKSAKDMIVALAISPDGKSMVSGGLDKTVRVWNLKTRTSTVYEPGPIGIRGGQPFTAPIFGLAFSPDGKTVICAIQDSVRILGSKKKIEQK